MSKAPQHDPWSGLLDPGEQILWQGQPDARIDWRNARPMTLAMGTLFCVVGIGVAGSTLAGAGPDGAAALVPLVMGVIFAGVGARAAIGDVVIDGYRRARTWYTLTDRRMLIATQWRGKNELRDLTLSPETRLVFEDGQPGSVLVEGRKGFGFRRIAEVREVYALMRQVQSQTKPRQQEAS